MRLLQWPYCTIHNDNVLKERDVITFYSVLTYDSLKLLCIMQRIGNGFTMGMKMAPN